MKPKRLYLLRHAKSDWNTSGQTDFERHLNERGLADAPLMGERLREMQVKPDLMITSSALRAVKTAQLVASEIDYPLENIQSVDAVYNADCATLLSVIQHVNNQYQSLMLVGHNPTFTELANAFTGDKLNNMSTCSVYAIEFPVDDWQAVDVSLGMRLFFESP